MKRYEGRLVGILGTIIIHLIAAIVFMSFQMKSLQRDFSDEFAVEFAPSEENDDKLIELPATSIEKILQGDEEMLNIARNLANKSDVDIDPDDYIDMVKEELIKSGKLGSDNYIDEQKKLKNDEKLSYENEEVAKDGNDEPTESQEMASNFQGPTRIFYDLAGRTHRYLPIPIYKCQGSGKVVLSLEVNQKGVVEKAVVIQKESTTTDPCLLETAVNTAMISRFNSDIKAPKIQTGTLTYLFVAQ